MRDLNLRDREIHPEDPETDRRQGRAQRQVTPRKALAELTPAGRSATSILVEQNEVRVPDLVGLRFARMLVDPLHFYRGAAAVMAADLGASPTTGIEVMCCGDAHLSNFGVFAAPDRSIVFDLNDFDEAAAAPAEWDLKRLVTSAILTARNRGFSEATVRDIADGTAEAYRRASNELLRMSVLDRFYLRVEPERTSVNVSKSLDKVVRRGIAQARKRTSARAFDRLTEPDSDGIPRFRETALTRHVPLSDERALLDAIAEYIDSVGVDVRLLLAHFTATDIAMRVVGVGSVGTGCTLTLFQDGDGHTLILQSKQAGRSVLEQYGGIAQPLELTELIHERGQGGRVVAMQRILQALSDPFLGSLRVTDARGIEFELYVRQFHDMKGGIEVEQLDDEPFVTYARACAVTLARAHAQSPLTAQVSGYLGDGARAGEALLEWGHAYARRSRDDYELFVARAAEAEEGARENHP